MKIDDQITRVKALLAKRDEIDAELAALFGGAAPSRRPMHCSSCGQEGHTAKACTVHKTPGPLSASSDRV